MCRAVRAEIHSLKPGSAPPSISGQPVVIAAASYALMVLAIWSIFAASSGMRAAGLRASRANQRGDAVPTRGAPLRSAVSDCIDSLTLTGRSVALIIADMGTFAVRVDLSHPERPDSHVTLDCLVDTGSTWSLVPQSTAEMLGVEPVERRQVRTADGRRIELPMVEVRFTIQGRSLTTPCLVGAPGAPALLGAVTLESFGLAADPVQKVLVPVTGLLL